MTEVIAFARAVDRIGRRSRNQPIAASFLYLVPDSTSREADKMVVMDLGRIVEVGTRDELMACGGFDYNLYTMQWKGHGDPAAD